MPAASTTPWGQAIDQVLADGLWHHRDEILDVAARAVPPGVAYRNGERLRSAVRVWGQPGPRKFGDQSVAVATGARARAREVLRSKVRTGTVQRDGDRFRRRSR